MTLCCGCARLAISRIAYRLKEQQTTQSSKVQFEDAPNILPSVTFPNYGDVSCFPGFRVFLEKKKRGNLGKLGSIRTALINSITFLGA